MSTEGLFVLGTWLVFAAVGFTAGWLRGTLTAKCVECRLRKMLTKGPAR